VVFVAGSSRASVPERSFATQTAPKAETAPAGEVPVCTRATTWGEEPPAANASRTTSASLGIALSYTPEA
jgi:hypothetical protein